MDFTKRLDRAWVTHSTIKTGLWQRYAIRTVAGRVLERSSSDPPCEPPELYGWHEIPDMRLNGGWNCWSKARMQEGSVMSPVITGMPAWQVPCNLASLGLHSTLWWNPAEVKPTLEQDTPAHNSTKFNMSEAGDRPCATTMVESVTKRSTESVEKSSTASKAVNLPAGLEMGRVETAFSCDWQEVNHAFCSVFSCFYVVHEGQFYCDFEFWLGFTVYSWHVGVRKRFLLGSQRAKTSAAAIFSGDLYIFAKYAPVFSMLADVN